VIDFSDDEIERYSRQIRLREIGGLGQSKLKAARIGLVGMGGIGAPAALYLAGAGVGYLRLIDHDHVSLSNLHRQILYNTDDIGEPKVVCAQKRLLAHNPHIFIDAKRDYLGRETAHSLLEGLDLVIDGTDQFTTKLLSNQTCYDLGIDFIMAAVGRYDGQVAIFSKSPCYQCYVPAAPLEIDDCATVGIVGAMTGIIGSVAALMAINRLTQTEKDNSSDQAKLWRYDGLSGRAHNAMILPDPACLVCAPQG